MNKFELIRQELLQEQLSDDLLMEIKGGTDGHDLVASTSGVYSEDEDVPPNL